MSQANTFDIPVQAALDAWEGWNALGVDGRAPLLRHFASQLSDDQARIARWQIDQALRLLGDELELPGPTGESNVLFTSGRGLVIAASEESATEVAILGQLIAALISGNVVLLAPAASHTGFCRYLVRLLVAGSCPAAVVQLIEDRSLTELATCPSIAAFALVGSDANARALNRQLSERDGVLVQLIAETDTGQLPTIGSEHYLARFITERVRTTNTTAVGGNATLLELGGKAE
ncbi:1-pyrroline-5-carboxylate dehydrogenase [Marinobacterium nitratireducens]|uniref:1-pyrroline-5-carboxylate dehydrogenase n=1 Tax=Marinobacterium nitratireducens TaxID=518897 RepID=A0A917ZBH9_9GAMM|nr:aldehyde dehydrogenase family protein [Marinobacterium nitratireducens]GGO78341.1 1-pyrroline-5-carboxylate dehydrogenase [Marinobacterium nitratireducens]